MSCPCPPSPSCLDLLNGIALLIDDQINDETSSAYKLKTQIEDENIPVIAKKEIPGEIDSFVKNLLGISFVILDWKFSPNPDLQIPPEVRIPENVEISATIDFLKRLLDATYCPVFIISQENVEEIKRHLDKEKITINGFHPRVFVSGKDDLLDGKLFASLNDWVANRPITYTLKTWEKQFRNSKQHLFDSFEKKSPIWPLILWKSFKDDNVNPSWSLSNAISNILSNHMSSFIRFEESFLETDCSDINKNGIRSVFEEQRCMQLTGSEDIGTGDLFRVLDENGNVSYLINIRAQCDLLHDSNQDLVQLYCLKGTIIQDVKKFKELYSKKNEQFIEKVNHAIGPFIDNCLVEFNFTDLLVIPFGQIRRIRFARLLPPYITRLQQRYALYLSRTGIPRTPYDLFFTDTTN